MQEAPIHQSHTNRSKYCEHFLKRVSQGIILWNYFKIRPAVLREYFLRISSCPYSVRSHVFGQIKILWTIFEKGHLRNIPMKLFQIRTSSFKAEDFWRISSCSYSARSPHSPEPCFWMDWNFANNFWKGSPKEHSCEIIGPPVPEEKIFKELLKNFHFVAMATRVF